MGAVWIAIGIAIVIFTLLDTFLAVLNYDEDGIFVNRIVRWQWVAIRALTRRVSRRWRPVVLRQVTGVLIVTTLLSWLAGLVLGFTFIYLGLIGFGLFQISDGVTPNFVGAFYLSVGQFSTAGVDNISPGGGWVNLLPVVEALLSVVMLSFFITFLSNIYTVIQNLRSLCADFFQVGPGVGSPVEALRPFFPDGVPRDIDLHLNFLINDFNLYCDSLQQDRAGYYFQSGKDQFALPYALYMTAGVVGALQWGLPTGHPASKSPSIVRVTESFDSFRVRRYRLMKWRQPVAPSPLSREQFAQEWEEHHAHRLHSDLDPWAVRFFALDDQMAEMVRQPATGDVDDAYERYVSWLAFTYPAQQFVADVSRDLDFQPLYRDTPSTSEAVAERARGAGRRRVQHGIGAWMRSRQLFLDPGCMRLWSALRTLGAVAVAVAIAVTLAFALRLSPTTAGAFAGLVALFASPSSSGWGPDLMRRAGILAVIPVAFGIVVGILIPRDLVWTIPALAVVAALTVWVSRFGPLLGAFGRLLFVAHFFALLLAVDSSELVGALAAAAIGVICIWIASFLPAPSSRHRIGSGIRAYSERVHILLDGAIDSLSEGDDGRLAKQLRTDLLAMQSTAAYLTALLDPDSPPAGLSRRRTRRLRLQVFDVDLAAENLLRALPASSDYAVTVEVRSMIASDLVRLQAHARSLWASASEQVAAIPFAHAEAPASWPEDGRRAAAGVSELATALERLHSAQHADEEALAGPNESAEEHLAAAGERRVPVDATEVAVSDRHAVQSGVSVGLALLFGGFVSEGAQYWAALPAYRGLAGAGVETWARSVQRILAIVGGAAVGFTLALWTDSSPIVAFAILAVTVFLISFLRSVASAWTVFWQTVLLATMYDVVSVLEVESVNVRLLETVIGAVVAIAISALILPTRTHARVGKRMSEAVGMARSVSHAAFQRLADPAAGAPDALADGEAEMDRQMRAIQKVARPLRHNAGSLQHAGIQVQLTSLWALLYYTRRLAGTAAATSAQTIAPAQWQQLDAMSRENFEGALAVLSDRLPAQLHDVRDVTFPAGESVRSAERDLLFDIERINETLLAYMEDIKPGSAGRQAGVA